MKIEGNEVSDIEFPRDKKEFWELVQKDKPEGIYTVRLSLTLFADYIKITEVDKALYAEWKKLKERKKIDDT